MRRKKGWVSYTGLLLGIIIIGVVVACNGSAQSKKPVIKLIANGWTASELNAMVAKILLEEQLKYPVEIVPVDENAQWSLLAQGTAHASLEVWPSGHTATAQEYIQQEKAVEDGGLLGPVGKIGWYIPAYLVRQTPSLATWEGLKEPQNVALFATADSNGKGQFFTGDPSWIQHDAAIIQNLGLNFTVVQLGTEDKLIAALDAAYKKQEPILLYFWTPHWAHILYDLTPVTLPPYSEACYAAAAQEGIACDYPAEKLYKIFWSGLQEYAPEAYQFLKNFNYTSRDQIAMLATVHLDGKTVETAARTWIKENPTVWQAWLPAK